MLTITIECNAPSGQAIGIKEDLAMYLEKYGDCTVTDITEWDPQQYALWREEYEKRRKGKA